jgi:hypothetical protein
MKEILKEFIVNNKLKFTGRDSDLNSESCILCGYALYLGVKDKDEVIEAVKEQCSPSTLRYQSELTVVWNFAVSNNYGEWWKSTSAKEMYKF